MDLLLCGKGAINELYDDLDEKVMDLYCLTEEEKQTIRQALHSKNNFMPVYNSSI